MPNIRNAILDAVKEQYGKLVADRSKLMELSKTHGRDALEQELWEMVEAETGFADKAGAAANALGFMTVVSYARDVTRGNRNYKEF